MRPSRPAPTLLLSAVAALGIACGGDEASRGRPGPNVLLYVVDTLRADALGAYGHGTVDTPAVDALAAEGWLFEHAYAPSSWTRSSVASLLTGTEPGVHGVHGREDALSDRWQLLSEQLEAKGYATAAIVTNPNVGSFFGFTQGFQDFEELYSRRERGRVGSTELVTPSDEVTDRAIEWLDRESSRPFFLFVLTTDPHWPYLPPARFDRYAKGYSGRVRDGGNWAKRKDLNRADRERIRSFYEAEVAFNDESFGTLMEHLRRSGLEDSTLVVFTADHGEEFWEHGRHGHGQQLFEESIRVPLILRSPALADPGRRVKEAVGLIDVAPTLLELLGIPIPEAMQGRSLAGGRPERAEPLHARLVLKDEVASALIDHPWKLIRRPGRDRSELFDLRSDPAERRDLAAPEAARVSALEAELAARQARNARDRERWGAGSTAPAVQQGELPEEAIRALEALGYIESEASEAAP